MGKFELKSSIANFHSPIATVRDSVLTLNHEAVVGIYQGRKTQHRVPWRVNPGNVGDRIWVREKWHIEDIEGDESSPIQDFTVAYLPRSSPFPSNGAFDSLAIRRDRDIRTLNGIAKGVWVNGGIRWRSDMPFWAARVLIEITGVRQENLLDISDGDARAEGVTLGSEVLPDSLPPYFRLPDYYNHSCARDAFLHKAKKDIKRFGAFDNPLLRVVEFKVVNFLEGDWFLENSKATSLNK